MELSIIILGILDKNLKLVSQQYRVWSDCTELQAGLTLYWLQRLIIFSDSRIRVNKCKIKPVKDCENGKIIVQENGVANR